MPSGFLQLLTSDFIWKKINSYAYAYYAMADHFGSSFLNFIPNEIFLVSHKTNKVKKFAFIPIDDAKGRYHWFATTDNDYLIIWIHPTQKPLWYGKFLEKFPLLK